VGREEALYCSHKCVTGRSGLSMERDVIWMRRLCLAVVDAGVVEMGNDAIDGNVRGRTERSFIVATVGIVDQYLLSRRTGSKP
jgi:hypothetical protein